MNTWNIYESKTLPYSRLCKFFQDIELNSEQIRLYNKSITKSVRPVKNITDVKFDKT